MPLYSIVACIFETEYFSKIIIFLHAVHHMSSPVVEPTSAIGQRINSSLGWSGVSGGGGGGGSRRYMSGSYGSKRSTSCVGLQRAQSSSSLPPASLLSTPAGISATSTHKKHGLASSSSTRNLTTVTQQSGGLAPPPDDFQVDDEVHKIDVNTQTSVLFPVQSRLWFT